MSVHFSEDLGILSDAQIIPLLQAELIQDREHLALAKTDLETANAELEKYRDKDAELQIIKDLIERQCERCNQLRDKAAMFEFVREYVMARASTLSAGGFSGMTECALAEWNKMSALLD